MESITQTAQPTQAAANLAWLTLVGAFAFGLLVGWYVYYINRYRKGDVQWSDLVTLVGIIGGTAVLSLFPQGTALFGAYGVGLAVGFFGYFIVLQIMVRISRNFDVDWFLDGRRLVPGPDGEPVVYVPGVEEVRAGGIGLAARRDSGPTQ
jgi:hypothetical protein